MSPPEKYTAPPMHTIDELDSPIRTFDEEPPLYSPSPPNYRPSPPPSSPLVKAENEEPLLAIDENHLLASSPAPSSNVVDGRGRESSSEDEEDEALNKKYVSLSFGLSFSNRNGSIYGDVMGIRVRNEGYKNQAFSNHRSLKHF